MLNFSVLKHQREFIESNVNTMLCGGYGSGKSDAGTYKTILRKLQYPQYKVAYYLPTYPLIKDIAFDKFPTVLSNLDISYKLNKSDKEIIIENYGTIIFRSMDNPQTIVGYEVAYSLIDEADILPADKMEMVYQKILGRNRSVDNANVDAVSTPEGFKWLYSQSGNGNFKVIKAKTTDNKFLPQNYIEQLKEQYPEQLLKAYLNGEFVNLTTGSVYFFDRYKNSSNIQREDGEPIIIGQDFNIGGCCSVVYVKRNGALIAVDEFVSNNTSEIITNTLKRYPDLNPYQIEFFPDASGFAGKTNASKSDNQMLMEAGFKINAPKKNGRVMDRVNSTNNALEKGFMLVNVDKCPNYTKALEQQSWDKNNEPEKFNGAATVDDWNDAGTYPIARLFPLVKPSVKSLEMSFA